MAREIASRLYTDPAGLDWIPSDDADVFRLTFTSGRPPRILKMARPGIGAVWREIRAFPAMRDMGVPEVLEFEHTSDEMPDLGVEFHVTRELVNPEGARQALADLWTDDRRLALDVSRWLGDSARRVEALDWRLVPRAAGPEEYIARGEDWSKPQYAQIAARPDCPPWVRDHIDRLTGGTGPPPDAFGGWAGEMLHSAGGRFVLIDWPGLGAAPAGSQAAAALDALLSFRAADPAPLVERFLTGWVPHGLSSRRLEDLRLWWAHRILWWAGLGMWLGEDPDRDLSGVYASAWHCLDNDDPVSWLRQAAGPPD